MLNPVVEDARRLARQSRRHDDDRLHHLRGSHPSRDPADPRHPPDPAAHAVATAAAYYLKSFPTQGHDIRLDAVTVAAGAALGLACGAATRLGRAADGVAVARAGAVAALLWIAGMAARAGFEFWATHGGAGSVARFSRDHLITGADAWTAALLLMALAQVVCRLTVVRVRARRVTATGPISAVA
ncbi:hypothetical protein [Streptomyces fagopyri]|uniref:hypothetical protein n=1 Tax=Streptomyces fagopyri TaxID=2662397 RepID=UPI002AD2E697|nr:hypothetical protein [Streptomyces fagopyri]